MGGREWEVCNLGDDSDSQYARREPGRGEAEGFWSSRGIDIEGIGRNKKSTLDEELPRHQTCISHPGTVPQTYPPD